MSGLALIRHPRTRQAVPDTSRAIRETVSSFRPTPGIITLGRRLELFIFGLIILSVVALHVRFVGQVGALWRDETNSVNLASLPTLAELWHFLDYDSFPILYFAVLRVWTVLFGVGNDFALRALGLLTGLAILAALWSNARAFGGRIPLFSFVLVGLNVMIIRYGDSNRAYGLGILLILLTLGSFWRLVELPTRPSAMLVLRATVFSILSVQCLYYNSILLFAIAAGACAVALRAKAWRTCSIVLAIGAIAAASLLPYLPIISRMREWTFMVSYPSTFSWLWTRAGEVMGSPQPEGTWIWAGLVGVAVVVALGWARKPLRRRDPESSSPNTPKMPAVILFALVTLVTGILGYAVFLRVLHYYTQPWYYITLAVFSACLLDAIYGVSPRPSSCPAVDRPLSAFRPAFALLSLIFAFPAAWNDISTRQTNADVVARQIEMISRPGDLIVVPRWERAISFTRYYHGAAKIVTIPPLTDHRFHRYDLILEQMKLSDAIEPVLRTIGDTLRTGHKVFLTDLLEFPTTDPDLPVLQAPYRDGKGNWHSSHYYKVWSLRTGRYLRIHAKKARLLALPDPAGTDVQHFETFVPGVISGWQ